MAGEATVQGLRRGLGLVTGGGGGGEPVPMGTALLVIMGQSNSRSAGVSGAGDIPAAYTALSSGDKARLKTWDHQNSQWLTYDPAVNSEIIAVSLWGASSHKWGPEIPYFLKWLADNPTGTLYLVKLGINGTGLDSAIVQPNWNPVSGNLYTSPTAGIKVCVVAAKANLASNGVSYTQVKPILMQGEADAMPDTLGTAGPSGPVTRRQANIAALYAAMAADWGAPGLIIGRIQSLDYPNTISMTYPDVNCVGLAYILRAADLAASDADPTHIKIVDLDTGLGGQPQLHPAAAWVVDMGERMWAAQIGAYNTLYGSIHDSTPAAFDFPDKTGQAASTTILSDVVTISGLRERSAISVSGGEYRILLALNTILAGSNVTVYQDWGSSAGYVENGQRVQLRRTSSASAGGSVSMSVTIGSFSDTFNIETTTETPLPGNTRSDAFEAKMVTQGAAAFNTAQHNALVTLFSDLDGLLNSGVLKFLAIPAVPDELAGRIRFDDQSTVGVKTGTPLWTAINGYNPNGAGNTYVDWGYNSSGPALDGIGLGGYFKDIDTNTGTDIQLTTGGIGLRVLDVGSGNMVVRAALNGGNASSTPIALTTGFIHFQRTSSSNARLYTAPGTPNQNVSNASTSITNTLTRLGGATSGSDNIAAMWIMDGASDANVLTLRNALVAFLTVMGSN